jgi:hypothetical protein
MSCLLSGGHTLCCGDIDEGRFARNHNRDVALVGAMPGWIVGDAVLPAAPEHAAPRASERADCSLVIVASS